MREVVAVGERDELELEMHLWTTRGPLFWASVGPYDRVQRSKSIQRAVFVEKTAALVARIARSELSEAIELGREGEK